MYRLKKNNIERLVLSKDAADSLIERGFVLLSQEEIKKSNGDTQYTKKSSKKE